MVEQSASDTTIWRLTKGNGPLLAAAVHDGHDSRDEVVRHYALDDLARLREEDPFTAEWTQVAPTRIIGTRSRFEVDLNRPRDKAVYRVPADAWGLQVWQDDPPEEIFERSLAAYDTFYETMHELFTETARTEGKFVVYDLHTYNHRRGGPDGSAADPVENPQVNIGTGTLDRERWASVIDTLIEQLRAFDFPGGKLDVRENVKFRGGNWPRWIHEQFPESACAIAIEFKKFFMDEWSGEPNRQLVDAIGEALRSTVSPVLAALREL
ncbi:MAG: N-formylglutamate amidohydrolase [Planctomycetia bacterium]|nr:N-formylglutamate amidohydrolase [Planctomycetia bacterium]